MYTVSLMLLFCLQVLSHCSQVDEMTQPELASMVPNLQQEVCQCCFRSSGHCCLCRKSTSFSLIPQFEKSNALLDSVKVNPVSLYGFIPTLRLVEHSISHLSLYYENDWMPGT